MRSSLPVFALAAVGLVLGLLLFRPPIAAEASPGATHMTLVATAPPASSLFTVSSVQTPEPPPLPEELTKFWVIAVGAVGSLILGIVKFFKGNLAKLPDWTKGLVALVLPSAVAFIAHLAGYVNLPADLATAVPLLAAGFIGMGLRALLKAFFPALSAATSS